jgi:hypothetical protein
MNLKNVRSSLNAARASLAWMEDRRIKLETILNGLAAAVSEDRRNGKT